MSATVSFVDVGQGDCTVAVDDAGFGIMIDCRDGASAEALSELHQQDCQSLVAVIVSHTHCDHFGGVLDVIEAVEDLFTGELYFNHDSLMAVPVAGPERGVAGKKLRALLNRAAELGAERVRRAEPPSAGNAGEIAWQLLAPTYAEVQRAVATGDPNLASAVVLLTVGDDRVVVGGDAQLPTWERIARSLEGASVLRWPHHGGALTDSDLQADERVLEILNPSTVVVSVGAGNTHGHPTTRFFAAVQASPARLLCTQATSSCLADGSPGRPCAETVRVRVGQAGVPPEVTPQAPNHDGLVASFGDAQCLRTSSRISSET
jgi:competence protein ComEC